LAVDPSSPFTKGAVLGDRIRYNEHSTDPGVFIRSVGTRGSLGGLSASAFLMVRALDLAGFDLILLETVGVGQTELEIMNVADWVAVVLVPESGDTIQGMKAGLLEIADAFIVNKGDRPGADIFARELEAALRLTPQVVSEFPPVIKTTATTGEGLQLLLNSIHTERSSSDWLARRAAPERLRAEARALLRAEAERVIEEKTEKIVDAKGIAALFTRR
jgi:LAO/AO transport system kinase